ncbi:MAG: Mov34/MPN/PAD-1 family protein [Cyanobacteria bacterium J06635_10]
MNSENTNKEELTSIEIDADDKPISATSNQITWVECEDVYKPVEKSIKEFIEEGKISLPYSQVYISKSARKTIKSHLEANTTIEQGGILFGQAYNDFKQGIYVEIIAAIPAQATIGTKVHLEFTPDSWQDIMYYAKSNHPEANIVGWYHSHPDIGVFMSRTDMRTQRAFFYHPWCVSIVYDPIRNEISYFLGEEAKAVKPAVFEPIL